MYCKNLGDLLPTLNELDVHKEDKSYLSKTLERIIPVHEYLTACFENTITGHFITDSKGLVLYINKGYEELTGYSREDLVGGTVSEMIDAGLLYRSTAHEAIKKKRKIILDSYFPLTNKMITMCSVPVFDEDGELAYIVGSMTDITDLVSTKEAFTGYYGTKFNSNELDKDEEYSFKIDKGNMTINDPKMMNILYYANKVAESDTTILITGETGVGKEELVKFIHKNSLRKDQEMVQINCSAIPENLLESELFGYVGGAFTGAKSQGKAGLFEKASGGTIFLDEIGDLPFAMQAKLLRALQEKKILPVGSLNSIDIDVRVIAATNLDLVKMIEEKKFREDLYYRLNVIELRIPPLRERKEDIIPLSLKFLHNANDNYGKNLTFSKKAIESLKNYSWPGNIRELKNVVERAAIMSSDTLITENTLFQSSQLETALHEVEKDSINLSEIIKRLEYKYMKESYETHKSIRKAASALEMDYSTFYRKFEIYKKTYEE